MTDVEQALREVSDDLLNDLTRLQELEDTKRSIRPDDPQLVDLATEVERIAARVLARSHDERQIVENASVLLATDDPTAPTRTIDETPRALQAILADWRDAERALAAEVPGSPGAVLARTRSAMFRDEYQRAFEIARADRPRPTS